MMELHEVEIFSKVIQERDELKLKLEIAIEALEVLKIGLTFDGVPATPGTIVCMRALEKIRNESD